MFAPILTTTASLPGFAEEGVGFATETHFAEQLATLKLAAVQDHYAPLPLTELSQVEGEPRRK